MNLADLQRTLENVLATGKLGTPVALRIHAAVPDVNPLKVLGVFSPLVGLICNDSRGKLQAQSHSSGGQLSVLWTDAQGRSVLISAVSVPKCRQNMHILLIGNHGVTRLSGGELWSEPLSADQSCPWEEEIRESLKTGTSIAVGLS